MRPPPYQREARCTAVGAAMVARGTGSTAGPSQPSVDIARSSHQVSAATVSLRRKYIEATALMLAARLVEPDGMPESGSLYRRSSQPVVVDQRPSMRTHWLSATVVETVLTVEKSEPSCT